MDDILEFVFELIFEFMVELSSNNKVPKFIRYPLVFIIICLFLLVIFGLLLLGVTIFKENIILGLVIALISLGLFVASIIKFKKMYLNKE